jgi:carbon storage regulator
MKERTMLVLTRRVGEQIRIGDDVIVTVVRIQGDRVRIGIAAPTAVTVLREEVWLRQKASVPSLHPVPHPQVPSPTISIERDPS